jgi:hypothetical protein
MEPPGPVGLVSSNPIHCNRFSHRDIPCLFAFPFPVPSPGTASVPRPTTPHLKGRADRCTLRLVLDKYLEPSPFTGTSCVDLQDNNGSWAGTAELAEAEDVTYGPRCMLMAVSKGGSRRLYQHDISLDMLPEMRRMELREVEQYDFVDVLLIEWRGDIAYRKGVGRVCNEVWERQPRGYHDVTLGQFIS